MGTGAWKSSPLLPHRAQTVPSPVPMQRLRSDNFHRLSAHTCYFPLSNLTFWYLTVSRVWHLKHLEEKQPAEAPREIRRKALIVSAGQWGGAGARAMLGSHPCHPSQLRMTLRKPFSFIRGDGVICGTSQNSFIGPCSCTSTNIWAAAQRTGPVWCPSSLTPHRHSWTWKPEDVRGVCDCSCQQSHWHVWKQMTSRA